ncbi:MAG: 1-deoxy-D-xylulose-5-phosphate reductoisomerase [bacterium]|nr:1-deoxy-D-xylulose-5-phosphate reductoisomerase [bacterium]
MVTHGLLILGSTGSIGTSTLEVVRQNPGRFDVVGLGCGANLDLLLQQIAEFKPQVVAVGEGRGQELAERLPQGTGPVILEGLKGQCQLAQFEGGQTLVAAMVGAAGIEPVLAGIEAGKTIALANKETIVLAGELIMARAAAKGVSILPVDSEHNAIYQSLAGSRREDLSHITLTASGGPFRDWPLEDFTKITRTDALNHPNWAMGPKITIDSATMMNKGLEVIEAKWLFDLHPEQIEVVIHPESILHSMVTFKDGSSIGQLGQPDMRVPIAYCLGQGERLPSGVGALKLAQIGQLRFFEPDLRKFGCLSLAFKALKLGGGATAALNGANEELVGLMLAEKIHFTDIARRLGDMMGQLTQMKSQGKFETPLAPCHSLADALKADAWGRETILQK